MVAQIRKKVLVFNPNTSTSISDSFAPLLSKLSLDTIDFAFWTCPQGPAIIKTQQDMHESTVQCLPLLLAIAHNFDGFLGACYADHPLVRALQMGVGGKPVIGIFDASIDAALSFVAASSHFGIITTGAAFEPLLSEGVTRLLGTPESAHGQQLDRFGGVVASEVGLADLERKSTESARAKMISATSKLLATGDIDVICMGGVILAGMEGFVREACVLELGKEKGRKVKIIDQITAGALALDASLRREQRVDFRAALR